jgi:hypothetical protein
MAAAKRQPIIFSYLRQMAPAGMKLSTGKEVPTLQSALQRYILSTTLID